MNSYALHMLVCVLLHKLPCHLPSVIALVAHTTHKDNRAAQTGISFTPEQPSLYSETFVVEDMQGNVMHMLPNW